VKPARIALAAVLTAEFIDPTSGINNLLFAGVERMAGRTDFYMQVIGQRRARGEIVATAAGDFNFLILGVYLCFHCSKPASDLCVVNSSAAVVLGPERARRIAGRGWQNKSRGDSDGRARIIHKFCG
jgi:hypothetical protein